MDGNVDGIIEIEGVSLGFLLKEGALLIDGNADGIIEIEGVSLGV